MEEWKVLEEEKDAQEVDKSEFFNEFGRKYDQGFTLSQNECFLHPLYNGQIVLTAGLSRENIAGDDRGRLRVLHQPQTYKQFSSKKDAIFAFDIIFLIMSLLFVLFFALCLQLYEQKSIMIVYTHPFTTMQMVHQYTARVLFVVYMIQVLLAFFCYIEGYFLNWRLHWVYIVPYLTVGYAFNCPLKMARSNDYYYGTLVEVVARKANEVIRSLRMSEETKDELLAAYPDDIDTNPESRKNLESHIVMLEKRLPKYRELYGSSGGFFDPFNLSFVGAVFSLAMIIYGLIEWFVDVGRYTGSYFEAVSEGGLRYVPNGDVNLYFYPPANYDVETVKNIQKMYMVILFISLTGFIIIVGAQSMRLHISLRNWGDVLDGSYRLDENKTHMANMLDIFPEKASTMMAIAAAAQEGTRFEMAWAGLPGRPTFSAGRRGGVDLQGDSEYDETGASLQRNNRSQMRRLPTAQAVPYGESQMEYLGDQTRERGYSEEPYEPRGQGYQAGGTTVNDDMGYMYLSEISLRPSQTIHNLRKKI